MNLLDPDIFPYTRVNGSNLPTIDATLKAQTPAPGQRRLRVDHRRLRARQRPG